MTTGQQHHWHGYGPWTGPHETFERGRQHEREPGRDPGAAQAVAFRRATTPAIQLGHYLLRPPAQTWTDVEDALAWLAGTYDHHLPDPTLTYLAKDERLTYSRAELHGGSDSLWHYTTSANMNRVVVYAVICCPHRHHTRTPCPLPPH